MQSPAEFGNSNFNINEKYFYEDNDIQAILSSRLYQLYERLPESFQIPIDNIHILAAVDDIWGDQLSFRLQQEKETYKDAKAARIALIPCNLGNYHWIGILFEFDSHNNIKRSEFYDSLNNPLSE